MDIALNLDRAEHEFLDALIAQERWAQQRLYETYYSQLMAICLRYTGSRDEALDMLHEAFIKLFMKIAHYKPGTSLNAWMRTVVVNHCIDNCRKVARQRKEDIDNYTNTASDAPDALSNLTEKEILDAVQQLPALYRTVFNLQVLEGYSHKEISDALGISEGYSRSCLVRARALLQESFLSIRNDFARG